MKPAPTERFRARVDRSNAAALQRRTQRTVSRCTAPPDAGPATAPKPPLGAGLPVSAPEYVGAEIARPAPSGVAPPAAALLGIAAALAKSFPAHPLCHAAVHLRRGARSAPRRSPGATFMRWAPLSPTRRRFAGLGAGTGRRPHHGTGAQTAVARPGDTREPRRSSTRRPDGRRPARDASGAAAGCEIRRQYACTVRDRAFGS